MSDPPAVKSQLTHFPPPQSFGPLPFSSAVLAGNTLYLSGHIGVDPATRQVPPEIDREIRLMMDSFRQTLAQAGLGMQHLVSVQIFCPDVTLFEPFNAIYRTYFIEPLPARAFLGSGPLLFNAHFEIQGIAVKA
jgi:enamine deaminase RidA (YjgF/YER057c/UK114 family)